nr:PREDICTED: uncharacterized protein LOC108203369 [Daucus carota subsp. sativus]
MRRSKSAGNFEPDPEIERTFRVRRQEARKKKKEAKMTDNNNANANLHVIVPDESSIQDHETPNPANCMYKTPAIGATQYNINPSLIQMGKALEWFQQLSDATLASWDNLSTEFLSKYYPSDKTQQMRAIILTFKAQPGEGLYQAWERYKALLRKCPHHGYEEWMVLSTFYGALNSDIRLSLDVAAGGNFKKAPVHQAKALLEELASNNYAWAPSGTSSVKSAQDTEMMNLLTLKLDALTEEVHGQRFQPPPKENKEPADWEIALSKMIQGTTGAFANMETKFEKVESRLDQMASSQKMLEVQIGQIANKVGVREQGSLPSQPDLKGNEQCKAITLRNGRELPEVEVVKRNEKAPSKKDELVESEAEISKKENDEQKEDEIAPKEMLSRKRKLEDVETIILNAECSAVIQKSIPQKLKDPGSFSLPCTIGKMENIKALCDLRASVSLMPYSICKRLGLGELKKTRISLQLADRTIKHPLGVIEDVLVKVDKFFIPCDFVVLDMDEDVEMPIILGRPFLATAETTIDVKAGKLTLNVGDEKVEFDLNKALKMSLIDATCFNVDIVDEIVKNGDVDLEEEEQAPTDKDGEDKLVLEVQKSGMPMIETAFSISEAPQVELKPLPSNLKYAFLGDNETYPVVVSALLDDDELEKLLNVLKKFKS